MKTLSRQSLRVKIKLMANILTMSQTIWGDIFEYLAYMNRQRGTDHVDPDEIAAANENQGEGNKLSILSFRGAFHGRTIGCISCTNSKGDIKVVNQKY